MTPARLTDRVMAAVAVVGEQIDTAGDAGLGFAGRAARWLQSWV